MATRKAAATGDPLASLRFGEAKERLEAILEELESNEVDIDDLADRIKEARDLIALLNEKLTRTKSEVERVMADFADDAAASAAPSPSQEGPSEPSESRAPEPPDRGRAASPVASEPPPGDELPF